METSWSWWLPLQLALAQKRQVGCQRSCWWLSGDKTQQSIVGCVNFFLEVASKFVRWMLGHCLFNCVNKHFRCDHRVLLFPLVALILWYPCSLNFHWNSFRCWLKWARHSNFAAGFGRRRNVFESASLQFGDVALTIMQVGWSVADWLSSAMKSSLLKAAQRRRRTRGRAGGADHVAYVSTVAMITAWSDNVGDWTTTESGRSQSDVTNISSWWLLLWVAWRT